jgi:hypothetical protein
MKAPNFRQKVLLQLRRANQRILKSRTTRYDSHRDFTVPVLVLRYLPLSGNRISRKATGDVDVSLQDIRRHTDRETERVVEALERGSAYHRYQDPTARPCLRYPILDTIEFLEPLPSWHKRGHQVPMVDYDAILERINIRQWVEERGVKQVWLWGYHGGVVDMWESNMAGPFGDISNSDQDGRDMPVLNQTYTLYHYNYGRTASEAVEDHIHQIEVMLRQADLDLFWNRFVGRTGEGRCGWAHYPPNGERDYDWANRKTVWSDIEDWRPDGTGQRRPIDCTRWNCGSLDWFVYWMQNLPGRNNGIQYRGRPLANWWAWVGDWDGVMAAGLGLV